MSESDLTVTTSGTGDGASRDRDGGNYEPPAPGGRRPRRRRWPWVALAIAVLLAIASAVASRIDLGYYVLTPGIAQPVGPLVKVPKNRAHPLVGKVLLTDVFVTRVTALSYVFDLLRPHAHMLPAVTVLGPATPPSQLVAQGYLEMAQSQEAAKAAALSTLGYQVHGHSAGALVFAVVPGSPAAKVLSVGEIVTAVDGKSTPSACAFSQALSTHRAGQPVRIVVERSHVTAQASIVPGSSVTRHVVLARWPKSVPHPGPTPACPGTGRSTQGFLGIEAETQTAFRFPFPVSLRTTSIGGPSAGLAMTLGILDTLSNGHLTGGLSVAATGTITPTGAVGEVGGVPQKTVAVEHAGATVFFVPTAQVATARSQATPHLRVYGVRSLDQVLSDLRKLGGSVPQTPSAAVRRVWQAGASPRS